MYLSRIYITLRQLSSFLRIDSIKKKIQKYIELDLIV